MSESPCPFSQTQSVKVTMKCSDNDQDIALCHDLYHDLWLVLASSPVGIRDMETRFGLDNPSVYLYGPDATALFNHVAPTLNVSGVHGTAELQIGESRVTRTF